MTGPGGEGHGGGIRLTPEQKRAWLRLIRSENVGPQTFRSLINHFGSAAAALAALPSLSERGGARRTIRIASEAEVDRELEAAARAGAQFVGLGEPDYPPWLREADQPPPLIAVRGDPGILKRPAVAIVGSRNASIAGKRMASRLANGLGEAGFAIVSGLARGIDAAAHEAALSTGTVAVFAGGVDIVYPPEHLPLLERIFAARGAAISEMAMGWTPRARDFPRRNRIIAGISVATIVVEAAERSGSLITARLALEQNREVMAVPGSPLDPRAAGANRLIKQGARLVTEVSDILEALSPMLEAPQEEGFELPGEKPPPLPVEPEGGERARVVEALGPVPVTVDDVIQETGLPARLVSVILLELELAGRLERHPGGRISLLF
ncbi:DNA-processing protein DprA [Afifella sp. IM 167]|uniref:DNA-processing protein DprA n=1 Tax=Afifella sp. IM 167 TaxID=2033586 RepID=UPI001CCACAD0|nr:DNA-processing protein DprA [Afifella sp. IM 167]MBZ8132618.1 DNA-protecting protein DprA [Afifella sp. IM 167]